MHTLVPAADIGADPPPPPPPDVTPEWAVLLEQAAAARGLPPDPWPLP